MTVACQIREFFVENIRLDCALHLDWTNTFLFVCFDSVLIKQYENHVFFTM